MALPSDARRQLIFDILKLIQVLVLSLLEICLNRIPVKKHPIPYHTSILSGYQWVCELLTGHPDRIRCELGVSKDTFLQLLVELHQAGYHDSKHITLEEQLAIFLYTCVTGLSFWHVCKCFQCSGDTVSK